MSEKGSSLGTSRHAVHSLKHRMSHRSKAELRITGWNSFAKELWLNPIHMTLSMLTKAGGGGVEKKRELTQSKILKKFLYFLVSFFPELKHQEIPAPQRTHFQLSQSAEGHKHFFFHFFTRR